MNADIQHTIIGLKTNVKKGYGLADYWRGAFNSTITILLKSWDRTEHDRDIDDLMWGFVAIHPFYKTIDSGRIGKYSTIRDMIIPAKDYTTKKGVAKSKPEERVPSHYDHNGKFLGRVSKLGEEPVSYEMRLHITPKHFNCTKGIGETIESCFVLKDDIDEDAPVEELDEEDEEDEE